VLIFPFSVFDLSRFFFSSCVLPFFAFFFTGLPPFSFSRLRSSLLPFSPPPTKIFFFLFYGTRGSHPHFFIFPSFTPFFIGGRFQGLGDCFFFLFPCYFPSSVNKNLVSLRFCVSFVFPWGGPLGKGFLLFFTLFFLFFFFPPELAFPFLFFPHPSHKCSGPFYPRLK